MSSISGVSGVSNAWANASAQRSQMQAKMFAKTDTDGSGGVSQTELSTMLSDISQKTGTTLDAQSLFTSVDSNSDGSLSSDELAQGLQSVLPPPPPPSTMEFAQNRVGQSGTDDLFSKVDTNSDGSVDETEMKAFTDQRKTETGMDSPTSFATLDANGDGKLSQTEFDAGKPSGTEGTQSASATGGPQGAGGPPPGGPPPAGGPGGASSTSSTSSSTQTYDALDTNEDGTVSELERLAGALKDLVSAGDSTSSSTKASDSLTALAQQIYQQIAAGLSSTSGSTLSAIA